MQLLPVTASSRLRLTDSDARPPKGLPGNHALHDALKKEVDELGRLQNVLFADRRYALLVVLQGRDASGKDGTIKNVFDGCNPMGCRVASFGVPSATELSHDYLWRVHAALPPRGFIGIFNRSHYEDVLVVRVHDLVERSVWRKRYQQINAFERMLVEERTIVLKFFLHVSREEQRERLEDRLTDSRKNWKFRVGDLDDRAQWSDYSRAYRDALRRCSTPWAPWYVVPADSKTVRNYLVTRTINRALRRLRLVYPRVSRDVLKLKGKIR